MLNNSSIATNGTLPVNKHVSTLSLIQFILHSIIFLGGLVSNLLLVIIITRRKKMQTMTNWLILNLAISDLVIILITLPLINITPFIPWPFGKVGCKYLVMPPMESFAGVCVLTHTAVALVRYYIVTHPMSTNLTRRRIISIIVIVWIIPLMVQSVTIMGILGEGFIVSGLHGEDKCNLQFKSPSHKIAYSTLVFSLTYVLPMVATAFAYIGIFLEVRRSMLNVSNHLSEEVFRRRENQVRKMDRAFAVMYIFFALTTLPTQLMPICHMAGLFKRFDRSTLQQLFFATLAFFYGQVLTNPLILFYMGDDYRKELAKILCYKSYKRFSESLSSTMRRTIVSSLSARLSSRRITHKRQGRSMLSSNESDLDPILLNGTFGNGYERNLLKKSHVSIANGTSYLQEPNVVHFKVEVNEKLPILDKSSALKNAESRVNSDAGKLYLPENQCSAAIVNNSFDGKELNISRIPKSPLKFQNHLELEMKSSDVTPEVSTTQKMISGNINNKGVVDSPNVMALKLDINNNNKFENGCLSKSDDVINYLDDSYCGRETIL